MAILTLIYFLLQFFALRGGNIFFTVDQGRDAVYIREILLHHHLFLKGPETSIRGIFTGPLWYYLSSIGYLFTKGNPHGGVLILFVLNSIALFILYKVLKNQVNLFIAILTPLILILSWCFFQTSLWSFNPFVLISLFIIESIFFAKFILGEKRFYYWALIPLLLSFNADLPGAVVMLMSFFVITTWAYRKKLIDKKPILIIAFTGLAGVIFIAKQFLVQILHNKTVSTGHGLGVFSGTNIVGTVSEFAKSISLSSIPQSIYIGIGFWGIALFLYFKSAKKNKFINTFTNVFILIFIVSFLFFSTNKGLRSWHIAYLAPLALTTLVLTISSLKLKFKIILFTILVVSQFVYFVQQYTNYLKPSGNPSLLYNETKVVDWIYQNSEGNGFNVYNYTNTFYDYSYQYLFSWYGKPKYGFYPCEYANYPLSHKVLYVPGYEKYVEPKLGCDKLRFLIIQSDTNGEENKDWINKFRSYNKLIESTKIGDILIEKYYIKENSPTDECIWRSVCQK